MASKTYTLCYREALGCWVHDEDGMQFPHGRVVDFAKQRLVENDGMHPVPDVPADGDVFQFGWGSARPFYAYGPNRKALRAPSKPTLPHSCPQCHSPALMLFTSVECSKQGCENHR